LATAFTTGLRLGDGAIFFVVTFVIIRSLVSVVLLAIVLLAVIRLVVLLSTWIVRPDAFLLCLGLSFDLPIFVHILHIGRIHNIHNGGGHLGRRRRLLRGRL
jgi:hypothetical protein